MAEQCGADVPDDVDEYSRDERIETLYQGWGAREMAERIVDLEDELGDDVDGICTGMHADVAEAHAEVERLRAQAESFRGWRASIYEVARCSFRSAGRSRKLADRYRLAWLSARRRAADEANFGMEALELKEQEIRRLRAELAEHRQTFDASHLEPLDDGEGGQVWRLVGSTSDAADVYVAPVGTVRRRFAESPASHSDASAP